MKLNHCPICDSKHLKKIFDKIHNKKIYPLDWCLSCRVFFVNPQPEDVFLTNLYNESYFTSRGYESKDKYRIRVAKKRISQITSGLNTSVEQKKALEIGCAMGHFLKCLKDKKADVYGVELSEYAAKKGKEKFNIEIFPGPLEKSDFLNYKFDYIFGWDLFEHLKKPNDFLKICHNILNKNGYLIIHIPYTKSPGYFLRGVKWKKINPEEHLFYYNHQAIEILAKKNSFSLIELPFSWLKWTDLILNDTKTFVLKKQTSDS